VFGEQFVTETFGYSHNAATPGKHLFELNGAESEAVAVGRQRRQTKPTVDHNRQRLVVYRAEMMGHNRKPRTLGLEF